MCARRAARLALRGWRAFSSPPPTMKVFRQKINPHTGNADWEVEDEAYDYHQEIARAAYADMLHDTERNQKYYAGLKMAIDKMHREGKKANVLDIGTGTGLLSMMAAQCGADTITACEAFQPMAKCALNILQHNNVADKIKVIPLRSTDIRVGEHGEMKQRANILVTEVFDTELIGEGALGVFSHAHECLLEKDCIVVPDSAVVYVQIVECPTLQKWNKLNDLVDEDLRVILRTPEKMKACAGSAAVHDIQLSQLPRHSFRALSDPMPIFTYDWSGKTPIPMNRVERQQVQAIDTGAAQMVFMWWDLNMDTEGKILLSCAPWWCHPDAKTSIQYPQDSIPWRDHWMQAVYYFPQELTINKGSEFTLLSCQDEYSLWFYIEDEKLKYKDYRRPICECGVHMIYSRTHVSYLNDGRRTKRYLAELQDNIHENSIVLSLHGGSLLGLATAVMGAKKVIYLEDKKFVLDILNEYIKDNNIKNVQIISKIEEANIKEINCIIGDPNFTNAILPWDFLPRFAYLMHQLRPSLSESVKILPDLCEVWAVPVQFLDLHKIRIPLGVCEGIDLSVFDNMIEDSRKISDTELEAQPLWEYPCVCRGVPQKLFSVDFNDLQMNMSQSGKFPLWSSDSQAEHEMNGFAVWASWRVGGGKMLSGGPAAAPLPGDRIAWDTHTKQGVQILEKAHVIAKADSWSYKLQCDFENGTFDLKINVNDS